MNIVTSKKAHRLLWCNLEKYAPLSGMRGWIKPEKRTNIVRRPPDVR